MSKISVAMTTFNGARHLREQLASLAAQTVLPRELQVGDDRSTDETLDILEDFAASAPFTVRVHRNAERLGFGENFIRTAKRCGGEWIAFCDQDDVWQPDKIEWAEGQIAAGPGDLMLLAHNAMVTADDLSPVSKLYAYPTESRSGPLGLPPEWFCIGVTQVFRTELLTTIPSDRRVSFPWHEHGAAHDVWIALLANCLGTVLRSDRQLVKYRRHGSTVTDQAKSAESKSWLRFHGPGYRERAAYLEEVSGLLAGLAKQSSERYAQRLSHASREFSRHGSLLGLRGEVLTGAKLTDRLSALRRVVEEGGYSPGYRWSFGMARLAKDVAGAFLASPA